MPMCPNCGSYVSEGSPMCSCGTSFRYKSSDEEEEKDPEEIRMKEEGKKYYHEGRMLQRQGKYSEALAMYNKARELGNCSFSVYEEGLMYYDMGNYEKALEMFEKLNYACSYGMLKRVAMTLTRLGRFDEAYELFFKALGIIDTSYEFIQDYSNMQYGMYFTDEELDRKAREKQLKKNKTLAGMYKEIAWTYMLDENYMVAIKYIDDAVELDEKANYWNVRAIILERMKIYGKSLKCYRKAIEMEKSKVFVENAARMIKTWCGELTKYGSNLKEAEEVIQIAIDLLVENETDEDLNEYLSLRNDIRNKIEYGNPHDYLAGIGRENLITIVSDSDFEEGMVLNLAREGNDIAVYYCGRKMGYVADSFNRVSNMTSRASDLYIGDGIYAVYVMKYRYRFHIARIN